MKINELPINIGEVEIGFFDLGEINEALKLVHDNYSTHAMNEFSEAYHSGRKSMLLDIITYFNRVIGEE